MMGIIMSILISLGVCSSHVEFHSLEVLKNTELILKLIEIDNDLCERDKEGEKYTVGHSIDVYADSAVITIFIDIDEDEEFEDMKMVFVMTPEMDCINESDGTYFVNDSEVDVDDFVEHYWASSEALLY